MWVKETFTIYPGKRWSKQEKESLNKAGWRCAEVYFLFRQEKMTVDNWWHYVSGSAGLTRTGKSCRRAWDKTDRPFPSKLYHHKVSRIYRELQERGDRLSLEAARCLREVRMAPRMGDSNRRWTEEEVKKLERSVGDCEAIFFHYKDRGLSTEAWWDYVAGNGDLIRTGRACYHKWNSSGKADPSTLFKRKDPIVSQLNARDDEASRIAAYLLQPGATQTKLIDALKVALEKAKEL